MTEQEAIRELKKVVKPGDTVYCILRHVSRSGMQRRISFVVFKKTGPYYLDYRIAHALGLALSPDKDGVVVYGCGMDMGFSVVYDLCRVLWGKTRKNAKHKAGYQLTSRWL